MKGRLLFMRHGSTQSNSHQIVRSTNDVPLDSKGIEQAVDAGRDLQDIPIDKIITTDLSRGEKTAHIIAKLNKNKPEVVSTDKLRPINWGDFTGMKVKDVQDKLNSYILNPTRKIPGGGTVKQFRENMDSVIMPLFKDLKDSNETTLLVMHNSQFRALPHQLNKERSPIRQEWVKPSEVIELFPDKSLKKIRSI